MELIDKNKAYDIITDFAGTADTKSAYSAFWKSAKAIKKMKNINAEQVVHCEDCKNYEPYVDYLTGKTFNFGYCYYWKYEQGESPNSVDDDDFCSHGELKK